jgi:hypothetical protein
MRRANRKTQPIGFILIVIGIATAGLIGFQVVKLSQDPFRTIPPLDPGAYLENANSLRGNVYRLDGVLDNSLAWSPAKGRLVSVRMETRSSSEFLPVLVPPDFNHLNLQKGQQYYIKIEVAEKGVLKATDIKKK